MISGEGKTIIDDEVGIGLALILDLKEGRFRRNGDPLLIDLDMDFLCRLFHRPRLIERRWIVNDGSRRVDFKACLML